MRVLVTGATGFVGSHVAEACAARGHAVHVLVRAGADASALEGPVFTTYRGDVADAESVGRAAEGVEAVVHCAAKVGDWGPVEGYRRVNVEGVRNLLEAVRGKPLHRFVHVSSLGVYEARHHQGTDESEPLPVNHMDGYTQSKVEAESLALQYQREHQVPVVVLRPGFVYGPRDRTVVPRIVENIKLGRFRYIGSADRALNSIYVGNLVEAVFLALDNAGAVGQIYNLTDGEAITKRRLIEALVKGLNLPAPAQAPVPLWLARMLAWAMEYQARRKGATEAPRLTQARLKFLGLNLDFSIEKARRELGYRPKFTFDEGIKETIAWYQDRA
jgi:nucleoside-diphosphate-sugar epimerase